MVLEVAVQDNRERLFLVKQGWKRSYTKDDAEEECIKDSVLTLLNAGGVNNVVM